MAVLSLLDQKIFVRFNYRSDIFGALSLGTPEYSGNMGMKDQQLAMKWVYDNIQSFGGDNKKIILTGYRYPEIYVKFFNILDNLN